MLEKILAGYSKTLNQEVKISLENKNLAFDPISVIELDMSKDHMDLARSILLLTEHELVYFELEKETEYTDFASASPEGDMFSRSKKKVNKSIASQITPKEIKNLRSYDLNKIEDPDLVNQVIGAQLEAKYDGSHALIARFSGAKLKPMTDFNQDLKSQIEILKIEADTELSEEEKSTQIEEKRNILKENHEKKELEKQKGYCPTCGRKYPEEGREFCPNCLPKLSIFRRLLSLFKPYTGRIVILMLMVGLSAVFNGITPYLTGTVLYDEVLSQDSQLLARFQDLGFVETSIGLLIWLVIIMTIVRILQQVTGIIHGRQTGVIVPGVINKIRSKAFSALQNLSLSFFTNKQTGSLMSRVTNDTEDIASFFIDGLPYVLFNLITLGFAVFMLFSMHWQLAIVTIIFLPVLLVVSFTMLPRMIRAFQRRSSERRKTSAVMNDNLSGSRVLRAFGQEEQLNNRFARTSTGLRKAEQAQNDEWLKFQIPYSMAQTLPNMLVWIVGALLILYRPGSLDFGQLVSFSSYVGMLQGPLTFFSQAFNQYSNTMNSAQRVFEIIDTRPEIIEEVDAINKDIKGKIEFKDVNFSYEINKPVLQDISFKVETGETLGIVGKSGAGKSTLVNLIARLYDVDSGEVLLDDINVKNLSFESLHGAIAMVSQETYIFMGTVAENIAYANPDATYEDIVAAASAAAAHDFIMDLPEGYDTQIGTGARGLSGGQRQRLSIARAILADPEILVLDEATASVDTETERQIQAALDELTRGRTTMIIAHRLSTLRDADRIIVLENGRLTEAGTQEELEAAGGEYHKLAELQRVALSIKSEGAIYTQTMQEKRGNENE